MIKRLFLTSLIALLAINLMAQKVKAPKLKTSMDSVSYSLGSRYGAIVKNDLKKMNEDTVMNAATITQSLLYELNDGKPLISDVQCDSLLRVFLEDLGKKHEVNFRKRNSAFLDSVAKQGKDSILTTESGLMVKITTLGAGSRPQATDRVRVHYAGRLIDGSEFDSSYKRGTPSEFALNQVIQGWSEGLQLLPEGSKATLYIPYNLGYGEHGMHNIPPYATLIFDIEFISIVK